jgi:hypothetical protein
VCRALLAALDASEGRRRRRKRDATPDAVGMSLKRWLLSEAPDFRARLSAGAPSDDRG